MSFKSMSCSADATLGIWEAKRERMRAVRNKNEERRRREGGGIGRGLVVEGVLMKGEGIAMREKNSNLSTLKGNRGEWFQLTK